jgi:hypothetical protein
MPVQTGGDITGDAGVVPVRVSIAAQDVDESFVCGSHALDDAGIGPQGFRPESVIGYRAVRSSGDDRCGLVWQKVRPRWSAFALFEGYGETAFACRCGCERLGQPAGLA